MMFVAGRCASWPTSFRREQKDIWCGTGAMIRSAARVGVYIAILEAIDGAGGASFAAKCVVILAAKL